MTSIVPNHLRLRHVARSGVDPLLDPTSRKHADVHDDRMCAIGALPNGGVARLALTDPDREAGDVGRIRGDAIGCSGRHAISGASAVPIRSRCAGVIMAFRMLLNRGSWTPDTMYCQR